MREKFQKMRYWKLHIAVFQSRHMFEKTPALAKLASLNKERAFSN